jgi:hypothetical protein
MRASAHVSSCRHGSPGATRESGEGVGLDVSGDLAGAAWAAPLVAAGRQAVALGGFSFVLLLVTGSWHSWFGDVCWGPRFMVSALPLLAVATDLRVAVHEPRLCEELGRPAGDRHRVVPCCGADGLALSNCVLRSALRIERVGVAGQGVTSQWVERPGWPASAQWHYGKRASTASRTSSYANSSSSASPSSSVVRW